MHTCLPSHAQLARWYHTFLTLACKAKNGCQTCYHSCDITCRLSPVCITRWYNTFPTQNFELGCHTFSMLACRFFFKICNLWKLVPHISNCCMQTQHLMPAQTESQCHTSPTLACRPALDTSQDKVVFFFGHHF